ncbi:TetR/AcrR family transcriptional regulator [Frankia tisae]|uniref:TetR/AcrR family transcriptional regulator n=1 Tax=Frankia tisae TaxID=2950104 RepID=UPI0021BE7333|nr:TetR/AcrR family transcriptional regulator [Frankia tisae]
MTDQVEPTDRVEPKDRPMRSHARRNRARILEVARDSLAGQVEDVSLNEVARRAGVGIGTLFRHFPSREVLLDALLHEQITALCTEADRLREFPDAGGALFGWLEALVAHVATYRGVAALLLTGNRGGDSALHESCAALDRATEMLLNRAQLAGDVRRDVRLDELISLVSAISWVREQAPERTAHTTSLLSIMVDGLRFPGGSRTVNPAESCKPECRTGTVA